MKKIESFQVDHEKLLPGLYVSRVDGDVTSYDMRVKKPNAGSFLTNREMHSFEHMFATLIRNGALAENVIYFGPMGCQTGFYLLVRNAEHEKVTAEISTVLQAILDYEGEVFGNTAVECGNFQTLGLEEAKAAALEYQRVFKGLSQYQ